MPSWNPDYRDFFATLRAKKVDFLVIGGVAYNYYAPPRATQDIDVWARPTIDNARRLLEAIAEFGFPVGDVDPATLLDGSNIIMLGRTPQRIDVLTRPKGLEWDPAAARQRRVQYGDVPVGVIAVEDLIAAKRASGRPRDLADVAMLERVLAWRGDDSEEE